MLLAAGKVSVLRLANVPTMGLHCAKRFPAVQALHMNATKPENYVAAAQNPTVPIYNNDVARRFSTQQRFRDSMSTGILAQAAPFASRNYCNISGADWVTYDPKFTIERQGQGFSSPSRRSYSTKSEPTQPLSSTTTTATSSSSTASSTTTATSSSSSSSSGTQTEVNLSKKEQLKRAFKDYGATIVAFHVGISLISLGGFYALVSSGINLVPVLEMLGIASSAIAEKVATGSTFVVAYAVHKVFAPVRISITLGSTPFIVRYLRSKGFMKPKVQGK